MPDGTGKILIVDDEPDMRALLKDVLEGRGHKVTGASNGREALKCLAEEEYAVVLSDIRMKELPGIELLAEVKRTYPDTNVILMTAFGSVESAIEAMKQGAYDYLTKPVKTDELILVTEKALREAALRREVHRLRREVHKEYSFHQILGKSKPMQEVFDLIRRVADSPTNVLITGESGTGKELVAKADKRGLFEEAQKGTLFLDEISELPTLLQAKLLRAIQEREIRRVGATKPVPVDVRIIAATNLRLTEEVKAKRFREDLYYRLNVIEIRLPPLRERREDIPMLVEAFLKKCAEASHKKLQGMSESALALLMDFPWPGNVRELENVIERAVTLARGEKILPEDLPPSVQGTRGERRVIDEAADRILPLQEVEKAYILRILEKTGGNKYQAAQTLGIDRKTLYRKLAEIEEQKK